MSGQLTAPQNVASKIVRYGADGLVVFNRQTGLDIDIETRKAFTSKGEQGLLLASQYLLSSALGLYLEQAASENRYQRFRRGAQWRGFCEIPPRRCQDSSGVLTALPRRVGADKAPS